MPAGPPPMMQQVVLEAVGIGAKRVAGVGWCVKGVNEMDGRHTQGRPKAKALGYQPHVRVAGVLDSTHPFFSGEEP